MLLADGSQQAWRGVARRKAIRFARLGAHHRQPLDWSSDGLAQAKRSLDRFYGVLRDLGDAPDVASFGEACERRPLI